MNWGKTSAIFVAAIVVLALDQIVKYYFFAKPALMSGFSFAKGLIQFTDYHNLGITFSLPFPRLIIIGFTIVLCVLIVGGMTIFCLKRRWIEALALAILLGGALGNLIDRVWLGFVRDWLLFFGTSAVNFADGAILVGGIWFLIRQGRKKASYPLDKQG